MPKRKLSIVINNKLKGSYGATSFKGNKPKKIEINVKSHRGDRAELASTIKHELLHVKHPKMTEKETYKRSRKTKINPYEQNNLISKLRMKTLNYKGGSIKRKFKMGKVETKPGEFISRVNENKQSRIISDNKPLSLKQIAIRGLV